MPEYNLSIKAKRLLEKIKPLLPDDIIIPTDITLMRTRAGHWQKSSGAWTALYYSNKTILEIGLYQPIDKLLKCPNLYIQKERHSLSYSVDCNCKGSCNE